MGYYISKGRNDTRVKSGQKNLTVRFSSGIYGEMKQDTHARRQIYVSLGLSEKEAVVYDLLLNQGEMAAASLERETGLKKNTYNILKSLEQKKLVLKLVRDGRSFYQPAQPENLRALVGEQEKALQQTRSTLEDLLPSLKASYSMSVGKPTVRWLAGAQGLKEVFLDIYSPQNKEVYGVVDLEAVDRVFPNHILGELIPRRVQLGIRAYSLVADSPVAREIARRDGEQLRETVLLNKEKYPLPAEVEIYRDRVTLMSFERGELVGLIIENKDFSRSMASIFGYLFELYRENKRLRQQVEVDGGTGLATDPETSSG